MARKNSTLEKSNGANLGFEEKLWAAADKLRGHMDAALVAIEKINPSLKGVLPKDVPAQTSKATIREFRTDADLPLLLTLGKFRIVNTRAQQHAACSVQALCQHTLSGPSQNPHIPFLSEKISANLAVSRQFPVASGHSRRYTSTSTPAGPLSQDTLSYGGFSFAPVLSARALFAAGTWS